MIHPLDQRITRPNTDRASIEYELKASCALPSIDCALTVKKALFSKLWLQRYNLLVRAIKIPVQLCLPLGMVMVCAATFFDQKTNDWNALLCTALLLPPLGVSFFALRLDVLKLLAHTYEFWYLTATQVVSTVILSLNTGDRRACIMACLALVFEYVLILDASVREVHKAIIASTVGATALSAYVVGLELELLRDYKNSALVSYGSWQLRGKDVAVNGMSVIVLVMLRNAYRKYATLAIQTEDRASVRLISYRARLAFVQVQENVGLSFETLHQIRVHDSPTLAPTRSQLFLAPISIRIQAGNTLIAWLGLPRATRLWEKRVWNALGLVGIYFSAMSVVWEGSLVSATVGLVASLLYTSRCFVYHNRGIARLSAWSFDFLFLISQVHLVHGILGHLLHANLVQFFPLFSSGLWMHWVVTLDLLTPIIRERLGIKVTLIASSVLSLEILAHILLLFEIIRPRQLKIEDRVLLHMIVMEKDVRITGVAFLLTRMVTTFCWCCHLMWRLYVRSENELLLIHGAVEYEDPEAARRLQQGRNRKLAVIMQSPPLRRLKGYIVRHSSG